MPLKLAFADMWSNFDPQQNFITTLLRILVKSGVEVTAPAGKLGKIGNALAT